MHNQWSNNSTMCSLAFTLSAVIDPQRNPAFVSTFLSISEHLPYLSPSLNVPLCGRVFPLVVIMLIFFLKDVAISSKALLHLNR